MKIEEAIKILVCNLIAEYACPDSSEEYKEALNVAISALEKQIPKEPESRSGYEMQDELNERDLVEVVRCKDCKHYRDTALGWCDIHSFYFDDNMNKWNIFFEDDYCSDGERR